MTTTRYFVPASTKPGDSLSYSDLEASERRYGYASELEDPVTLECHVIDLASGGDYSGSGAIERSNYRVMLADPEIAPHLVTISGSHGSYGLGFLGSIDDAPEAIREVLGALDNYFLLSDDDHSHLEMELESEAWESDGKRDFATALTSLLADLDPGYEHDLDLLIEERWETESLYELWRQGCDAFNVNGGSGYVIETGEVVHFYIDEWIEGASLDPDRQTPYPRGDWFIASERKMHERLLKIARLTGAPDTNNEDDRKACDAILQVARDARLEGRIAESERMIADMRARLEIVDSDEEVA